MTENEKYLNEARAHGKEFETQMEPERLRDACMALENVILARAGDLKARSRVREEALALWLQLLQLLDSSIDPKFDPNDVPGKFVEPPAIPGGAVLRPGASPAKIADPRARADYEKAIAANRVKSQRYRLQTGLAGVNERISPRAEAFVRGAFTSDAGDQTELKIAIEKIKDAKRNASLSKLLKPSQP